MKKALSLLVALVMCLSLCACGGNKATLKDYSGKWVREEWTNTKTGAVVNVTVYLYEDGTYKKEVNNSIDGYQEYQGTWEIEKDTIVLNALKIVEGTDTLNFDENGNIKEGITDTTKLTIIDKLTLENGGNKYNKEVE